MYGGGNMMLKTINKNKKEMHTFQMVSTFILLITSFFRNNKIRGSSSSAEEVQ